MTSNLMATQDNAVRHQELVSDRHKTSDREGALGLEIANMMIIPRFRKNQRVCFVGGVGTIRSCRSEAGTWTYAVEMEMGPEPDMGRIGSETTILLHEADIHEVMK